jgi:hypothetical protein
MGIDTSAYRHFMKKKLADTLDKNGKPTNEGDLVFFNIYPPSFGSKRKPRPKKILGKITRINGAYIYVANVLIPEDSWEMYSTEIEKASTEKAVLWMLENS